MKKILDQIIKDSIKEQKIQCCVVQVNYRGNTVYEFAKGYGEFSQLQVNQDTIFQVTSITKPIIATLILILQDERKLDISDSIVKYLTNDTRSEIRIQDLLTHTSGLVDYYPTEFILDYLNQYYHIDTPSMILDEVSEYQVSFFRKVFEVLLKAGRIQQKDVVDCTGYPNKVFNHIRNLLMDFLPPLNQPGSVEEYCNYGYDLLACIICAVTQKDLQQASNEKLFGILGMEHTLWTVPEYLQNKIVKRYKNALAAKWFNSSMFLNRVNGHDGLKSTVPDMMRFLELIREYGVCNGQKILSEKSMQLLLQPCNMNVKNDSGRTMGFHINTIIENGIVSRQSTTTIDHGGMGGTRIMFDPFYGVSCAFFSVEEKNVEVDCFDRFINAVYDELNITQNSVK